MRGLPAEILGIIHDCRTVTREQLVAHFVRKRNLYPDSIHKAIHSLIVGGIAQEVDAAIVLLATPKDDAGAPAGERKQGRPRKYPPKPPSPPRFNEDGLVHCRCCLQYLPPTTFGRMDRSRDGLQSHCRPCRALAMARRRSWYTAQTLSRL